MASAVATTALHKTRCGTESSRWKGMLIKDSFIDIGGLSFIVLSAVGAFNSCDCWGRALWVSKVTVSLVTNPFYKLQGQTIFPEIVTPVLFFQLCFCASIVLVNRRGVSIMRWTDQAREEMWLQVARAESQGTATESATAESEMARTGPPMPLHREPPEEADGERQGLLNDAAQPGQEEVWFNAQADANVGQGGLSLARRYLNVNWAKTALASRTINHASRGTIISRTVGMVVMGSQGVGLQSMKTKRSLVTLMPRYDRRYYMILWTKPTATVAGE